MQVVNTTNTLYFVYSDHLGSVSLTTDASGVVVSRQAFYPHRQM